MRMHARVLGARYTDVVTSFIRGLAYVRNSFSVYIGICI